MEEEEEYGPTEQQTLLPEAYKYLISTEEGKAFVKLLLTTTGALTTTFSADPYQAAFLEGRRAVGMEILQDILAVSPEAFTTFMKEWTEYERRNHKQ